MPIQFLYVIGQSVALVLAWPLIIWLLWTHRGRRKDLGQRFGIYSDYLHARLAAKAGRRCWVHAASIGEAHVALHLIAALQQTWPNLKFVLTTETTEGRALVQRRRPENVELLFFPFDFPWCLRRAYRLIQPDLLILVEMELWPNHLWFAAKRHVPIFLINARMPLEDARRYQRFGWFFGPIFALPDMVCAQGRMEAVRFNELGVSWERMHITGNLKFDVSTLETRGNVNPRAGVPELLRQIGVLPAQPILVAGSTHAGEEAIFFDLIAEPTALSPKPFLIVAPRDLARVSQIVALGHRKILAIVRRSEIKSRSLGSTRQIDCLVVDTMGELAEFYEVATISFVGKSLVGHGGQNLIEPAACGHPVVFGPHMENFEAIVQQFLTEGAAVQVQNAAELRATMSRLLLAPAECRRIAAAAERVIRDNCGATERTVALIEKALKYRGFQ